MSLFSPLKDILNKEQNHSMETGLEQARNDTNEIVARLKVGQIAKTLDTVSVSQIS
jgi:hypothetical protein